jgi:Tol biopolymer transport system component
MPRASRPSVLGVLMAFAIAGCSAGGASPQDSASGGATGGPSPSIIPASSSPSPSAAHGPALPGRIAFGRYDNALEDFQIFTMLADGSDVRRLVPGAHEGPSWSPDDSVISVTDFEDGNFLEILRPDGSLVRDLKAPDATLGLGCDNWSPDGTRFACEGWDDSHPDRIGMYTVRASDGGDLQRLTSPADHQHDIPGGYSPDGMRIAFVHVTSEATEQGELWIVNADGSDAHRASDVTVGYGTDWSPDGRWIVGDGGGSLLIFDASAPSSAPRRITFPDAGAFGASWSPDGSRLAFSLVSAGRNTPDIATVAVDGSDLWILTSDPAKEEFAAWGLPTP